ncbi:MAG TPA: hypothetical protein VFO45_08980 [Sphingomicrobium sp.]|nr:hypothetical protein [Sphingomicrobium sp.]
MGQGAFDISRRTPMKANERFRAPALLLEGRRVVGDSGVRFFHFFGLSAVVISIGPAARKRSVVSHRDRGAG